ncbi:MAG TPA: hypothetical protein VKX16_04660 [Chloroflexota bacterium]|nr:hypothetical protein [Chloroflexota bacterium]
MPDTSRIFGHGNDVLQITSLVAGPRGSVAFGQRMVNESGSTATERLVWASPDDVHWRRGPAPFSEPRGSSDGLVAWQRGFVDLTSEGNETVVWASADGLTWTRVGSDGLFGGTARIMSATAFRGGVVAIGSFARHPQPACLRATQADVDLRAFHPAAFLWAPAASATIPAPAVDRSDPRALKLLPYDLAAVQHFTQSSSTGGGYGGAYVSLCSVDPTLGRHRAYQVFFDDPASRVYPGQALSIITQSPGQPGRASATWTGCSRSAWGLSRASVSSCRRFVSGRRHVSFSSASDSGSRPTIPSHSLPWAGGMVG